MFGNDDRVDRKSVNQSVESADLKPPGYLESIAEAPLEVLSAPSRAILNIANSTLGFKNNNPAQDFFDEFNHKLEGPNVGTGLEATHFLSSIPAYFLPPYTLAEKAAVMGVSAVGSLAGRFAPKLLSDIGEINIAKLIGEKTAQALPKFVPKTLGDVGSHLSKAFAIGATIDVPQAVNESYNKKTGKFDIIGGAKHVLAMGGMGMALDSVGIAAGMIYGRMRRAGKLKMPNIGEGSEKNIAELDKSLSDGDISKDQHEWAKTYLTDPNNTEKLKELGSSLLVDAGYKTNTVTHKTFLDLMGKDDFDNFSASVLDQLGAHVSEDIKSAFSDYQHGSIADKIVGKNKHMIDGLMGFVSHLKHRLSFEEKNMGMFKKIRSKEDYEHIKKSHPISESSVFNRIKAAKFDTSEFTGALTKNIKNRVSQEIRISLLKKEVSKLKRKQEKGIDFTESMKKNLEESTGKINEIKSKLTKLSSPKDELKFLEDHFTSKDGLPENFKSSDEYHRLGDLAEFSEKARSLLHHVDTIGEYDFQRANSEIVDSINSILKSSVKKFANPEKLFSYMKQRLDDEVPSIKDIGDMPDKVNPSQEKISKPRFKDPDESESLKDQEDRLSESLNNSDAILSDMREDVEKVDSKSMKDDFNNGEERFKEYKKKAKSVFKEFISCSLGA